MAYSVRWGQTKGRLSASVRNIDSMRRHLSQRRSLLATNPVRRRHHIAQHIGARFFSRHYAPSAQPETPDDLKTTIDNILLKTEFETKRDIREYLRKWQEQNLTYQDPVRGPGTSNANLPQSIKWTGNMLNDGQAVYEDAVEQTHNSLNEAVDLNINTDDNYEVADILEPGDLVGFYSGTTMATPAVYIRSVERQKQYYTLRGKWRVASDKDIDIVIKNFAPKELTDALIPYLPDTAVTPDINIQQISEGGVPRSASAPLMAMLQQFSEAEKKLYRDNAKRLDNLYALIASPDKRVVYTLPEIAAKALDISIDDVTPEALFMTQKAIQQSPFLILADRSSIFSDRYLVRPKSFADCFNTVIGWVREHEDHLCRIALYQPSDFKGHPLQKFLQKAQKLILQSRSIRSPTTMSSVGPSAQQFEADSLPDGRAYQKVVTEQFDHSDKIILEYLIHFSIPPHRINETSARYAAIHIMRSTGLYTAIELQRGAIPLLLQELGIFPAWENIYALDHLLALPGHNIDTDAEKMMEAAQIAASDPHKYQNDTMADMRVDWGDLPIYCIDDPGAKEIDDGISLEPVAGTDDTFWLRVHIANPTAFLPPHDDPISENAARRLTTVYLPERHYPMLPSNFTTQSFSLAPNRPTLTISAKVNTNGDVLEADITNGLARNVIYLTHTGLRNTLDGHTKGSQTYIVGKEPPSDYLEKVISESPAFTEEQTKTFNIMQKIMTQINTKWRENGGLTWPDSMGQQNLSIYSGKPIPPFSVHPDKLEWEGGYFQGDPSILLPVSDIDPYDVPNLSRKNLVALVMRFACHIAGRWSADRNIPLVYDGTYFHPEYPPLTPEKLKNFTANDWLRFAPPKGYSSSSVLPHGGLGVDAYTKVTSPLRRYSDMVAHYQIEAALRYERTHNKKFNSTEPDAAASLPFSTDKVDLILENMKAQYPLIKSVQTLSQTFWVCQFLFRAFYFGECEDLPETFPCLVRQQIQGSSSTDSNYVRAYAADNLPFGIRVQLFVTEEFRDLDTLSTVEAKIVAVNMAKHVVEMEVVRKVKGWERTGDWA
ncbi:mitochondrial exoribonuclease Cyt-4, putative [Talaromyces stipitatus ATCC 10500]|uniref:Mitochondrial exoribonuclease Cyt-4, putative n=1 Tax=Talaromyces stipitatus (strain ATCC 10500 / CBS 375.48 / QM 6759 / NRRL 1006) TaxID=441959 RepID=B8MU35_TALSN|nr:mitochondrial exoribonuclease Cyt-4, putative [Talaromyces stipitatus ATCC 10500]EED12668.1 mitochondrial exoribonuclease Cyt-4, putative [Talaromyces stipitatus ATCC 10500]